MSAFNERLLPQIIQVLRGYFEGEIITQSQDLDKELSAPEISDHRLKSVLSDKLMCVTVKRPSGGFYKELINFETRDHPFIARRFWGYGSYITTHHTPQGADPSQVYPAVSIVLVRDILSFLSDRLSQSSPYKWHTLIIIIYELGKFKISFEDLKV